MSPDTEFEVNEVLNTEPVESNEDDVHAETQTEPAIEEAIPVAAAEEGISEAEQHAKDVEANMKANGLSPNPEVEETTETA